MQIIYGFSLEVSAPLAAAEVRAAVFGGLWISICILQIRIAATRLTLFLGQFAAAKNNKTKKNEKRINIWLLCMSRAGNRRLVFYPLIYSSKIKMFSKFQMIHVPAGSLYRSRLLFFSLTFCCVLMINNLKTKTCFYLRLLGGHHGDQLIVGETQVMSPPYPPVKCLAHQSKKKSNSKYVPVTTCICICICICVNPFWITGTETEIEWITTQRHL